MPYQVIAERADTNVYFTDPHASCQKGAIENANGFVRQYIPKSSDIKQVNDKDIEAVRNKINARQRKKTQIFNTIERGSQIFVVNLHLIVECVNY